MGSGGGGPGPGPLPSVLPGAVACQTTGTRWPSPTPTLGSSRTRPSAWWRITTLEVIGTLTRRSAVIGHSFGGLLAQIIAGRGQSAATVAIDAAPFHGVLPLPLLG